MVALIPVRGVVQGRGAAMKEKHKKKIAELIKTTDCEKGFKCRELKNLCKAADYGLPGYAECLEQGTCQFKVPYGNIVFCRCPVRVYIVKNLGI